MRVDDEVEDDFEVMVVTERVDEVDDHITAGHIELEVSEHNDVMVDVDIDTELEDEDEQDEIDALQVIQFEGLDEIDYVVVYLEVVYGILDDEVVEVVVLMLTVVEDVEVDVD